MKLKTVSIITFLVGVISCTQRSPIEITHITTESQPVPSEIYLSDEHTLNVFYDITVSDTCILFADFFSDSLIQIRSLSTPTYCIRALYKGNGPYEYKLPYFDKAVSEKQDKKASFIDINIRKSATIRTTNGQIAVEEDFLPAEFPACSSLNRTEAYTYGGDVEMDNKGLFFIWDNRNSLLKRRISYYPETNVDYKESSLPFLYQSDICVNPQKKTIAVAMLNMNLILFYDLEGNLKSISMAGEELQQPQPGNKFLDFSDETKCFTHISGSEEYVYALYNGTKERNGAYEIFVYDWSGKFINRYKLDRPLHRIAATLSGEYLFGISENDEGGTDVLRIPL